MAFNLQSEFIQVYTGLQMSQPYASSFSGRFWFFSQFR